MFKRSLFMSCLNVRVRKSRIRDRFAGGSPAGWVSELAGEPPALQSHLIQHFDTEDFQPLLEHAPGQFAEREAAGAGLAFGFQHLQMENILNIFIKNFI